MAWSTQYQTILAAGCEKYKKATSTSAKQQIVEDTANEVVEQHDKRNLQDVLPDAPKLRLVNI
jgi:hypothetical protein